MKQFAVIGNPISHSLSPRLHNYVFKQLGINAKYSSFQCALDKLPDFINQLRNNQLNGVNVTLPLKQEVLPLLDDVDEHAKIIGAVNCINVNDGKLTGHNTDWIGFIQALQNVKIEIKGKTFIIIGAGGVARSIIYALALTGVNKIFIINRSVEHANILTKQLKTHFVDTDIKIAKWSEIEKHELHQASIVNCTSLGMAPYVDNYPVLNKYLFPSQTIIDVIYSPFKTKLIQVGQSIGATTLPGLSMLIHQALASFDIWFGESISERIQMVKLYEFLKQYC